MWASDVCPFRRWLLRFIRKCCMDRGQVWRLYVLHPGSMFLALLHLLSRTFIYIFIWHRYIVVVLCPHVNEISLNLSLNMCVWILVFGFSNFSCSFLKLMRWYFIYLLIFGHLLTPDNWCNMGAKISNHYISHSFGLISSKLYDKYDRHVEILAMTFWRMWQYFKILWH